ncbi:MAG TPA: sigma-70 family RNA polymerase sigma factor [Kofleriaceae bacterium]|nr:sigma-70 family RNA polymerase sigma factor [Kofleriaceae bacterium]
MVTPEPERRLPPVIPLRPLPQPAASAPEPFDLEELFRLYAPYVAKIGHRLLGRGDEVDDLVQDVFLAAHRGLRQLREREAIKGWLATVAVRLARRRLRRRRLWGALGLDGAPDYDDIVEEGASPEQRALAARVYRLLDRLPVEQRMAWTLRHVEGESLERVAELCRCSLATAKRRIKAAQDGLRHEEVAR